MRWTRWIAIGGGLMALAGCGYGFRMIAVQARYSTDSRPHPSYFCYDCHGYRYFDPYYDYCASYGFRYRWTEYPETRVIYRDRYVRIKESHPDYGRYRYREGYRAAQRYREPQDYQRWRSGAKEKPASEAAPGGKAGSREQDGREQGNRKKPKGEQRKGPRDTGSRSTLPGGVS